jgi:cation/acetate symporter
MEMTQVLDQENARERANLDGRIAFVAAAFALAFAFAALLDRVGAPPRFVEAVAPCFTVAALAVLGFLLHSMRVSLYYVAGRAAPTEYAGFALATCAAGVVCVFSAQFAAQSWFLGLGGGVFAGVAAAGLWVGPLLRKSGAFSLSGLFAQRFGTVAPRLIALSLSSLTAALVALAGQQAAVDALTGVFGGGRVVAATIVSLSALLIAAPGGLFGTFWTACAAGAVAVLGFGWPVMMLMLRGAPPFGSGGSAWREVSSLLEHWGALPPSDGYGAEVLTALAAMLGMATLGPLLAPAVASRDAESARRAGLLGCGWTLLLAWLIATTVAGSALSLSRQSLGQAPQRLPDALYDLSGRGQLAFCGVFASEPAVAHAACGNAGAALKASDLRAGGDVLLTGLSKLEGMGAAASGLSAAARVALAMALAAAGLQAFGTTLGHEALYRMRGGTNLTSRRLATTRLALVGLAALGLILSGFVVSDPEALIGLALCFSAGLITPLAGLALWPRVADRDALAALLAGLIGMVAVFAATGSAREVDVLAAAALIGAISAVGGGAFSVLSRPAATPAPGDAFVRRLLRGDGEVVERDRGA